MTTPANFTFHVTPVMFARARPLRRAVSSLRVFTQSLHIEHIDGADGVNGKSFDPLRILFCGSDPFSIASLRALQRLSKASPHTVQAINVVCRKDKRVGRGLKQIRAPPIKDVAHELGLTLHQIDTFTGWQPPASINLVVAVSFGLLVPSRIINGAKYGGLNVHPSLLPDLRGPAPIQHAILKGRRHTGVTLQTMHPTRFDHGAILAQTAPNAVVVSDHDTTGGLIPMLSEVGAEILCKGLQAGVFVEPVKDLAPDLPVGELGHAPKIQPEDRHIDWTTWTLAEIDRRDRAIGNLWDTTTAQSLQKTEKPLRTTFEGPWEVLPAGDNGDRQTPGSPFPVSLDVRPDNAIGFWTTDGCAISPTAVTVEGSPRGAGMKTVRLALQRTQGKNRTPESTSDAIPDSMPAFQEKL